MRPPAPQWATSAPPKLVPHRGEPEHCAASASGPWPPSRLLRDDSPVLSLPLGFPESSPTFPWVVMGGATTRTRLVVRPLLVSVEDTAALLGIGRTTLYELIRHGDVRPIRIGRCVRIPQRELEAYADRLIGETWSDR